jgi:hypothetical protein
LQHIAECFGEIAPFETPFIDRDDLSKRNVYMKEKILKHNYG